MEKINSYLFINASNRIEIALKIKGESFLFASDLYKNASEVLLPSVEALLGKAGVGLGDIDVFGAAVGPGSFTGIRVGLATVKAFAQARGRRVFGVNSLRLNAYNVMSDSNSAVISIIDGSNGVVYAAAYDNGGCILAPTVLRADKIDELIASIKHDVVVVCDNPTIYPSKELRTARLIDAAEGEIENSLCDYVHLEAFYLRKAQPDRRDGDL